MDCELIERDELIEKYLGGRLEPSAQDEFEVHLLECVQCTRAVEMFQTVRIGLLEREAEIRTRSRERREFWLRWQTVAVAATVILAVGLGALQLRNWRAPSAEIDGGKKGGAEPSLTAGSQPTLEPGKKEPENTPAGAKASELAQAQNRSNTNTKEKQAKGKRDTPESDVAPANQPVESAERGKSNEVSPGGTDAGNDTANRPAEVAEGSFKLVPSDGAQQAKLTTEQGVELARIGMVEAPAYTFAGFVPNGKLPKREKTDTYSKDGVSPGAGRALFQKAMSVYVGGQYLAATSDLEGAVQLEPNAADINFYLGVCRLLDGHPEDAVGPLKKAAAAGQSVYLQSSHYFLAKAYVQGNRFAEAEEEFRKAIATPGRLTSDARGLLARLQTLRGQIEKR